MNDKNILVEENIRLLRQGISLIAQIGEDLYTNANPPFFKSGVGNHFRHCIDFYDSFLSSSKSGRINYALRKRNRLLEIDGAVAIFEIEAIINDLEQLSPADLRKQVYVMAEDLPDGPGACLWSSSTVMRELQSLLSHTTHHYAMIALALRLQDFDLPEEFGVAQSTLNHWRKIA